MCHSLKVKKKLCVLFVCVHQRHGCVWWSEHHLLQWVLEFNGGDLETELLTVSTFTHWAISLALVAILYPSLHEYQYLTKDSG